MKAETEGIGPPNTSMQRDVVIVGVGLAGFACARRLTQLGVPFLLLEAEDRVGVLAARERAGEPT